MADDSFVIPRSISKALANFLGSDDKISRCKATARINEYIKANNLSDPANNRVILPDDKLSSIMVLFPGDVVTYFHLQDFIKHNFA